MFQAFSRIIREAGSKFVVMDTAPTGHTLLLLDATGAYHREVAAPDGRRRPHFTTPMMQLQDGRRTKVLIVTLAETTPVLEAAELQADLRRAGIEPWAWIVNESLAFARPVSPLLQLRAASEVKQIDAVAAGHARRWAVVPLLAEEPVGIERLRRAGAASAALRRRKVAMSAQCEVTAKRAVGARSAFFERYLTVWVALCIVVGIVLGQVLPGAFQAIGAMEIAKVNLPVGVLIWVMIIPMLLKIDFGALHQVKGHLQGHRRDARHQLAGEALLDGLPRLALHPRTCSRRCCPPTQIDSYIAGLILLAAAPCTAMVFVWSRLTNGDPYFTLSQVALNDTIMIFAFAPIVGLAARHVDHHRAVGDAVHLGRALHRDPGDPRADHSQAAACPRARRRSTRRWRRSSPGRSPRCCSRWCCCSRSRATRSSSSRW